MFSILNYLGIYKLYENYLKRQINLQDSPNHIAIILDGNRRWARSRLMPVWMGHLEGASIVTDLLDWCNELNIKIITLYALSSENLQRPDDEVQKILDIISDKLTELINEPKIDLYEVHVKGIGNLHLLPLDLQDKITLIEEKTKHYNRHFFNLALAYGGRFEIIEAVKNVASEVQNGLDPNSIDQNMIENNLSTSHLPNPDPDLVIRTSGEERLSGFLLWQSAYSELVFLDVYWPDFRKIDLMRAIRTFQKRARRFGK